MAGLNIIQRPKTNKKPIRIGRGGLRGKTSGRGHKGQKARAGTGGRTEMRDFIKKFPKRRGYGINRADTVHDSRVEYTCINLDTLSEAFKAGETVSATTCIEKGLAKKAGNKMPTVKILGRGEIKLKLTVEKCAITKSAKEAIEKAGGSVIDLEKKVIVKNKGKAPRVKKVKEVVVEKKEVVKTVKKETKKTAKTTAATTVADDLTKIEGIGPVIAKTLTEAGIATFAQLADAKDDDTQEMIKDVRGNHQADTWNEQAGLARDGKWDELKELQDRLDGGVEK